MNEQTFPELERPRPMLDPSKLVNELITQANEHRKQADGFTDHDSIWAARMSAAHVLNSLAIAILKAQEPPK